MPRKNDGFRNMVEVRVVLRVLDPDSLGIHESVISKMRKLPAISAVLDSTKMKNEAITLVGVILESQSVSGLTKIDVYRIAMLPFAGFSSGFPVPRTPSRTSSSNSAARFPSSVSTNLYERQS